MVRPVYALVGTDIFLQLESLKGILLQAPKDVQRVDVDGETAQLGEVLDELRSFAMFSSSKLVAVRNGGDFITRCREGLEQYVANPAPDSILVLRVDSLPSNQRIHKLIVASGQIIDCNCPKDLPRWIMDRARQAHKMQLGPPAAQVLADLVGGDLGRLDNEMAKLALQASGAVNEETIRGSISFQREQEMWDMTNELAVGKTTAALERWRHLVQLDSSAEFRAMTWLTMWLEKVRKALLMRRRNVPEAQIARTLKIFPFGMQKPFFQTAAAIGESGAGRLIELLAELDLRSKSGLGDMAENVERFILAAGRRGS
jgi:DNA polymerase III subunit delta